MSEQNNEQVDVIALARESDDFRRVVITGKEMQVVVMTIPPGEEIGAETHEGHDQILLFVDGEGEAVLDGTSSTVSAGDLSFVHAGVHHNFINTGDEPLRIITAYAPPEHPVGTVHEDKAEADAAEHDH
ncbi:MAG: cupin domain-containing protein [Nitriliruptor sp.]|nr:MAG: cupin domain-containing protein [Nitriliruptor sp.]